MLLLLGESGMGCCGVTCPVASGALACWAVPVLIIAGAWKQLGSSGAVKQAAAAAGCSRASSGGRHRHAPHVEAGTAAIALHQLSAILHFKQGFKRTRYGIRRRR